MLIVKITNSTLLPEFKAMQEETPLCLKCKSQLIPNKDNDFYCHKCRKIYSRDKVYCSACMTPKVRILNRDFCPNNDCPTHIGDNFCCSKHGICSDYIPDLCNSKVYKVKLNSEGKVDFFINIPRQCFIIKYSGNSGLTGIGLQDLLKIAQMGYTIKFVEGTL